MAKQKCRDFEEVVRQIAHSEEDVDKVLKAAKLQRTPKTRFWYEVLYGVCLWEVVLGGLVLCTVLMTVLNVLFG